MLDRKSLRHRLGLASNNASLEFMRHRLSRAENELTAARAAMRDATRRLGMKTAGLFGDSAFVPRSVAEEWASDAFADGHKRGKREGVDETVRAICRAFGGPSPDSVEIAEGTAETRRPMAADAKRWKALRAAGFMDAIQAGDYGRAAMLYLNAPGPPAALTADAIRQAAALRDAGGPQRPMPRKDSLAGQILAAGQRRRMNGRD